VATLKSEVREKFEDLCDAIPFQQNMWLEIKDNIADIANSEFDDKKTLLEILLTRSEINISLLQALLAAGADVNKKTAEGKTPLELLLDHKHVNNKNLAVYILLNHNAEVNVNLGDKLKLFLEDPQNSIKEIRHQFIYNNIKSFLDNAQTQKTEGKERTVLGTTLIRGVPNLKNVIDTYISNRLSPKMDFDGFRTVLKRKDYSEEIKKAIEKIVDYTETLQNDLESCKEGTHRYEMLSDKLDSANTLINNIVGAEDVASLKTITEEALADSKLTKNRGSGFYWLHGLFTGKRNNFSQDRHHFVRSTLEELTLDLHSESEKETILKI